MPGIEAEIGPYVGCQYGFKGNVRRIMCCIALEKEEKTFWSIISVVCMRGTQSLMGILTCVLHILTIFNFKNLIIRA